LARQFSVAEYRKPEFDVKLSTDRKSYVHGDTISVSGSAAYYFGQPLANATVKWRIFSRDDLFNGDGGYQFVDGDILSAQHGSEEKKRTEGEATADAQGNFTFTVPADLTQDVVGQLFTVEATITDATNQEVSSRTDAVVHKGAIYAGLRPEKYVVRTGDPAVVNVLALDEDGKPAAGARVTVSFFNRKWNSVKERQPDGGYVWSSKPEDTLITSSEVTVDSAGKGTARIEPKTAGTIRVTAEVSDPRGNKNRSATNLYASGSGVAAWRMESTSRVDLVPDKKEYQVGDTARVLIPSPIQDALALVTVERGRVLTSQVIRLNGNSETIEVPIQADFLPNVFVSVVLFKGSGPSSSLASFRVGYGELKVSPTGKALKVTLTPDKPKYQPGEKATYTIRTADSSGKGVPAEVSLAVVDASVLALADETTDDPMKLFWGRRTLATGTSATLSQSVDLFNADLSVQRKGAGGGGNQPTVRREFPDTAYWNPSIRTDDKGEATVAVTMPDSLTTWKATARAVTAATQFGSATAETVVSKDLLLRPAFPRFMLMGDHLTLTALLSNYTGRDVEAEVGLTASGVQPEKDGAFAPQRVRVAAGAAEKVEWPAKVDTVAADGAKATLKLDARVLAGDGGDSVEITLPVKALSAAEVVATSGEVRDSTTELVRLPDGINSSLGELTIETSPSLAAGMRYSARYLAEFPWECTEQTVSRFLPRIVMQRAFDKLKLPDTEGIAAGLPATVTRGIQTLYTSQRPDGGWGWWPSDPSDQWISAYAVQGLAEAARSGYTVDPGVIERATQYLRRTLDISYDTEHPENLNSRAYVLYVLAAAGKGDVGLTNSLYERRSALGNYGKAYLLLALNSLGAGTSDSKLKSLASDLSSAAVTSAAGAHWEESQPDYRAMNTSTRSTAIVLDALVRTFPDNQWIQPAVRWLMVARKDGHWETTQETAWSLLALTDFLQASGELAADFAYRVQVNGSEQSTDAVKSDALDQTRTLVIKVKDLLQGADNSVNMARAKPDQSQGGAGKLYYTMALRYFLPGEQVEALSQGLAVAREYYRQGDEAAGPVTQVKPGETVKVKLTLVALQDLHYVALDDPLPAGLEAVDTRLKTTSIAARADTGGVRKDDPSFNPKAVAAKPLPVFEWWKYNYFGHVEPRDDRVALFANFLPTGTYEYTYLAKATTSGEFQILPAQAYEMYFPDASGRSYGGKLTVAP
ncbi:MAG TPA: alpha-2-macroglobulin family protein, partial [Chloroflexota bacterium]